MTGIFKNRSTASVLAERKGKSMFPVFIVRNPMPNNKCDVKHSETTKKSRNTHDDYQSEKRRTFDGTSVGKN